MARAVMDGCNPLVRGTHDDRATGQREAGTVPPFVPQAGQGDAFVILAGNEVRLLLAAFLFPFIQPRGWDQAASRAKWATKSRLRGDGLDPGIERAVFRGWCLGPERDESPAQLSQFVSRARSDE
jgi:hypothetical protein